MPGSEDIWLPKSQLECVEDDMDNWEVADDVEAYCPEWLLEEKELI
jgi:hypothetical protein